MSDRPTHPAGLDDASLLAECDVRRQRRSGPGGQHRNKVETGVVLTHRPSGTTAEATERRSQADNQRVALRRLRIKLALSVRGAGGEDRVPSPVWRSRCHDGRVAINPNHRDFPQLLAEALDAIVAANCDLGQAGEYLACTPSQLVKLLKLEPQAFAWLNGQRADRGMRPLR